MEDVSKILAELILAIELEATASARQAPKEYKLSAGRKSGKYKNFFLYDFDVDKEYVDIDVDNDSLGLSIESEIHYVLLGQRRDFGVTLKSEKDFGDEIPSATLAARSGLVLRGLKRKLEATANDLRRFRLPREVFQRVSRKISNDEIANFTRSEPPPTISQRAAIESSFHNSLAILHFNPQPAASKIITITQCIETHLNAGRRLLFLSSTDQSLDVGMAGIIELLKNTFYKNSQMVRLGVPSHESFNDFFPLVSAERLAERENDYREDVVAQVHAEIEECQIVLDVFEKLRQQEKNVAGLVSEMKGLQEKLAQQALIRKQIVAEYNQLNTHYKLLGLDADNYASAGEWLKKEAEALLADMELRVEKANNLDAITQSLMEKFEKLNASYLEQMNFREQKMAEHQLTDLSTTELESVELAIFQRLSHLQMQVQEIKALPEVDAWDQIRQCKFVATTLTRAAMMEREDFDFDVVFIEGAENAAPAFVLWAASLAAKAITLYGDFQTVPRKPACAEAAVKKWFGENILDRLELRSKNSIANCAFMTIVDGVGKVPIEEPERESSE